ncbi:MAG: hypothetical protein KAS32_16745 [Candidatus Peribacteraceae bacterium]|nr:hypothetical protein [Candidatus Peribacteraceae bacterium]
MSMHDDFKKWDNGEFTYNECEDKLMEMEEGIPIGDVLSKITKCPVHNSTCDDSMYLEICGFNPRKGHENVEVMLCGLGVDNIDNCPLSK